MGQVTEQGKISVIIPFYQTPKIKLRCCIESFLNQTFQNFELLLVDDGNTKEYQNICTEYEAKDGRVKHIAQKHTGVAAARNNGIVNAQGEYLVFADSDDYVDAGFLELMYRSIQGYDLVICGVCEQCYAVYNGAVDIRVFCSTPSRHNWLQYVNFSVNKIYKKSIIDEHRIWFDQHVRLGEDALFLRRYFTYCRNIRCIADQLYHYVPNAQSAVKTYYPQYWSWEKKVIAGQNAFFHQYPLTASEEDFMKKWMYAKVKGAVYYYYSMETDRKKRTHYVRKIMGSSYYKKMFEKYWKNKHYTKREKIQLTMWKLLGMGGVKLGYLYSYYGGRL